MQVSTATAAELIAFFNANTGGNPVKKFADRKTAERRVQALVDEMIADGGLEAGTDRAPTNEENGEGPFLSEANLNSDKPVIGEFTYCPHCNTHLVNGIQTYENLSAERNHDVDVKAMKHEYMCLACGETFGPAIVHTPAKPSVSTGKLRPSMVASMKIDRQIIEVTTGLIYKNACQVWKAGLITSSQCDRLSATLYGAAKQGNRLMSLSVAGHVFTLAVK